MLGLGFRCQNLSFAEFEEDEEDEEEGEFCVYVCIFVRCEALECYFRCCIGCPQEVHTLIYTGISGCLPNWQNIKRERGREREQDVRCKYWLWFCCSKH